MKLIRKSSRVKLAKVKSASSRDLDHRILKSEKEFFKRLPDSDFRTKASLEKVISIPAHFMTKEDILTHGHRGEYSGYGWDEVKDTASRKTSLFDIIFNLYDERSNTDKSIRLYIIERALNVDSPYRSSLIAMLSKDKDPDVQKLLNQNDPKEQEKSKLNPNEDELGIDFEEDRSEQDYCDHCLGKFPPEELTEHDISDSLLCPDCSNEERVSSSWDYDQDPDTGEWYY